ncbi:hypothetical protein VIGAN_09030700 [Vigna angularis var. angularis]|uniref:Uncharacterized protein n=1 Tax=Vigna angularis var. angularis TaxID=157739 RepID=A0A0S3SVQ2_PHAAN|nr:hypothetical protein VIGAN_09030700 [Vigna angularis var. angularis]
MKRVSLLKILNLSAVWESPQRKPTEVVVTLVKKELDSRVYFCSLFILIYLAMDIRYVSVRNLVHTVTLGI